MPSTPPAPRVRPRDAASLILLRRAGRPAVLMGRRARRHRFLPDVFAFPGGSVDREDASVPPLRPLRPEVLGHLERSATPRLARALATAAVRETFEETGLLLGKYRDGVLYPDLARLEYLARAITPASSPIRFHARFFLADAEGLNGGIEGSGELVDLQWVPLDAALTLPLADITEFLIGLVRARLAGPAAAPRELPLFTYRNDVPYIRHE